MAAVLEEEYGWKPRVIDLGDSLVEQGVNVYVFDNDGTVVVDGDSVSTDAQGTIAIQWLQNQIRTDTGSGFTQNLETPHKVRLTKYTGTTGFNINAFQTTIADGTSPDLFVEQNPNITLNISVVSALTGITIDTVDPDITVSLSRTITELYHYAFWQGSINPISGVDEFIETVDGNNFISAYPLILTGGTLDGEDKSISASLTTLSGGNLTDITIVGNVLMTSPTNLTNVTIIGNLDIDLSTSETLNFNNVTVTGDVQND